MQSNIFAFVDSLGAGDRGRAIKLLEDLISTGEPPPRAMYMVRRQFRLVARARALFARGASRERSQEPKVPLPVARKLEEQARVRAKYDLEDALGLVLVLSAA